MNGDWMKWFHLSVQYPTVFANEYNILQCVVEYHNQTDYKYRYTRKRNEK